MLIPITAFSEFKASVKRKDFSDFLFLLENNSLSECRIAVRSVSSTNNFMQLLPAQEYTTVMSSQSSL